MKRPLALALVLTALALLAAGPAAADPVGPTPTWVPDGTVRAVAISGSTAYIGGKFSSIAPHTGGSFSLDPQTGQRRASWPDVSGYVRAAVGDGGGGWYIGGEFTSVGGVARQNLAHVRADGSVDPDWTPSADQGVSALVLHGGKVYVGGGFDDVNGQPHPRLAALDSTTGASVGFKSLAGGYVSTLVLGGDKDHPILYVGGNFTAIDGVTRHSLAAISLLDDTVTGFDPNVDGTVYDIALDNGVYAGGRFNTVNGNVKRNGLANFDPAAGMASSWDPHIADTGATVFSIEVASNTVYAGGRFTKVNSDTSPKARSNASAFDATSAVATAWDPQISHAVGDTVATLTVAGSAVYVGGQFSTAGGQPRSNVAAVSTDTGQALAPNPAPHGYVDVIAGDQQELIVGGSFWSAGGVTRKNIGAIDLTTGEPTSFDPNVNRPVNAIAVGDSGVWAGGGFDTVNGVQRSSLANLDPATGAVRSFSQEISRPVLALAVDGSTVYAGGEFLTVGNSIRQHLAAFRDVPGSAGELLAFDPDPSAKVAALSLKGGNLYLGGDFTTLRAGADERPYLASVDASTGVPTTWNPAPDHSVYALAPVGNDIVAGGLFKMVNGATPRLGIAAFDAESGAVTGWDAQLDAPVYAVASDATQTFAGGWFTHAGVQDRSYLGAFDPLSGTAAGWDPGLRPNSGIPVQAVAATPHEWLVAGGDFILDHGSVRTTDLAVYRLSASDPGGPGTGGPGGGGTGGGTAGDRTPPVLSGLTASKKRFRVGKLPRRGTRLSFKLSEKASVSFKAFAVKKGHRTAKGRFSRLSPAGASRVAFSGRLGKRRLGPGRYVLRLTPTDAAGNIGAARSVTLRVLR